MPPDGAATLYAVALRVARLDATGATPAGVSNMYVTNSLVKVTFTPVYEEGDEVTKKDGQGNVCLDVKGPNAFKRVDLNSVEICAYDPELSEILAGGAIITDGAATPATIGHAAPASGSDPQPYGISLEVWTRRYIGGGGTPAALPYARYAFPKVKLRPTERAISADAQVVDFTGEGYENPTWGNGPNNDWPTGAVSGRAFAWVAVAAAPAGALGYQATPTQT